MARNTAGNLVINSGSVLFTGQSVDEHTIVKSSQLTTSIDTDIKLDGFTGSIKVVQDLGDDGNIRALYTDGDFTNAPIDFTNYQLFGLWLYFPDDMWNRIQIGNSLVLILYTTTSSNQSNYYTFVYDNDDVKPGWNFIKGDLSNITSSSGSPDLSLVYNFGINIRTVAGSPAKSFEFNIGPLVLGHRARTLVNINNDDSPDDCYDYLYTQIQSSGYNWPCTTFNIPESLDTANKMTTAEVTELHDAGWDIGHHGSASFNTLTLSEIGDVIDANQAIFNANGWTNGNNTFSYPQGAVESIADKDYSDVRATLQRKGIQIARGSYAGFEYPSPYGVDDVMNIRTIALGNNSGNNYPNSVYCPTAAIALQALDDAIRLGACINFQTHLFPVTASTSDPTSIDRAELQLFLDGLRERELNGLVDVVTLSRMYEILNSGFSRFAVS